MAESPQPTMQKRTMSLKSFSGETCSSQSDFPTESSLPAFTVTSPLFPPESKTRFLPPIHYLDALSDSRVERVSSLRLRDDLLRSSVDRSDAQSRGLRLQASHRCGQSGGSAPEHTAIVCVSGIFGGLQ